MSDKDTFFTNAERSLIAKLMLDTTYYKFIEDRDRQQYSVRQGQNCIAYLGTLATCSRLLANDPR